ncbi:muscular LMNA-interacting protein [Mantella aurantiaca]
MDLGRHKSKTVSDKDLKVPVMASSTEEGTNQLIFTFVPAIGTLPSQVLVGKDQLPKVIISHEGKKTKKAECEQNLKIKTHEASENFLGAFHKLRSGNSFSKEETSSNNLEEIKHNDLFIAEFVEVMDFDDGEDEKIIKNKKEAKDDEFISAQRSTVAQPKATLTEANVYEIDDPEAQQVFNPDMGQQELQQHLYMPIIDVKSQRFQLTNPSHSSKEIPKCKGCTVPFVPVNIKEKAMDVNTFPKPLLSQESNYFNVSIQNAQLPHTLTSLSHSQIQRKTTAPEKCIRSNAMSPLPIKIIKHPLCRSPSPLSSQFFGSSSTICSLNDSPSPVPKPETTSRLSFLTSLLKSKKAAFDRTISPDQSQNHSEVKSASHFYKTAGTSSPPRISKSCFTLNNPKDFKISNVQRENEKQSLPSASSSDILHTKSSFYSRSRSLSPESIPLKSYSGLFFSRKGVVSPLLELPHQPNTLLNSSIENISHVNEKPPLNRQSYTPLKKYSVLGKSRSITLFPPPLPFYQTFSNTTSRKQNVMPYVKRQSVVKDNLRPSFSFSENLNRNCVRSTSPMEITEGCRFPPSYLKTYQLFNENADSKCDVSPSLPSYKQYFDSSEELSRNYTPTCTSPTNIFESSRSNLSRSCELRSASSLSQSSDQENKQSYKIKSSYRSFAAIPTNTLLRDQKAIDKPEISPTTASKENMDPHQKMCSPALLRQQTEEICAAIDEVLHDDPMPMHYKAASKPAIRKKDLKSASTLKFLPKSAGRETKYASIQHLANTRTNNLQKTRPGVIRPISLKISASENMDGPVSPFDFQQQFSMPQYNKETRFHTKQLNGSPMLQLDEIDFFER